MYIHVCDMPGHSSFFCGYFLPSFFANNYLTVVGEISLLIFFFQTFRCLFFISMYMCVCVLVNAIVGLRVVMLELCTGCGRRDGRDMKVDVGGDYVN